MTEEKIKNFFDYLQGTVPDNIKLGKHDQLKLTPKKAMSVIWFLQEHLNIIPTNFEMCSKCKNIFDVNNSGYYKEKTGKFYCDCSWGIPIENL